MPRRGALSLTTRFAALYALSSAVVLLVAIGLLQWAFRTRLQREDVEVLREELQEVREILGERAAGDLRAGGEILREASVRGHGRYLIRVLDSAGVTVAETRGMGARVPTPRFPNPTGSEPAWRLWRSPAGEDFLLASARVDAGGAVYQAQVALDRTRDHALIADYQRVLLLVLIAGVLASTAAGIIIARRGLAPLRQIVRTAAAITPERLSERVGGSRWPAELSELAAVFDRMLERLEDSFRRLSRFSADIAHELRTPVGNVAGELEVALSHERTPGEYQRVLESALEECGRLSGIIDALLFLARAENGSAALSLETCDLGEELRVVCDFFAAAAEEKGVELACAGSALAEVDRTLLRRALDNLLSNALHHTPAGGRIELALHPSADSVEVEVSDTGSGIPPEHLARVTDRFFRGDPARSSHTGGSGLGLALVKTITQLHGGSIAIRSSVGRGTTVVLRLPRSPADLAGERMPSSV